MTDIRKEFEAAYAADKNNQVPFRTEDWINSEGRAALWAAAWMAERIAHDAEPYSVMLTEHIRQLAKELRA